MTNTASIDYADVVEQLAVRQWERMTRTSTSYGELTTDQQRGIRALVEPILADLLALHGRQYEDRAICEPAPTVWATVTIRMDRGTQPEAAELFEAQVVTCPTCEAQAKGAE